MEPVGNVKTPSLVRSTCLFPWVKMLFSPLVSAVALSTGYRDEVSNKKLSSMWMNLVNDRAIGGYEEHAPPGTPRAEMKSKLGARGRKSLH